MPRKPEEVWSDWNSAVLEPKRAEHVSDAVQSILSNLKRYEKVGAMFGAPGWVIGVIHYREASFNFKTWLANGDPLFSRGRPIKTVHVPKGLGPAPDWEEGAMISLRHDGWHVGQDWDLVHALLRLEAYNGMGYYNHGQRSPYIWSGTNHYHFGKYTSDGHFDPTMRDQQLGCAAIAIGLKTHGIDLNEKKFL